MHHHYKLGQAVEERKKERERKGGTEIEGGREKGGRRGEGREKRERDFIITLSKHPIPPPPPPFSLTIMSSSSPTEQIDPLEPVSALNI